GPGLKWHWRRRSGTKVQDVSNRGRLFGAWAVPSRRPRAGARPTRPPRAGRTGNVARSVTSIDSPLNLAAAPLPPRQCNVGFFTPCSSALFTLFSARFFGGKGVPLAPNPGRRATVAPIAVGRRSLALSGVLHPALAEFPLRSVRIVEGDTAEHHPTDDVPG